MQASTSWDDVAFSSTERDRHLGIRPVSQLNTWPVVSPVNASRRPSRDAAHHSGSGRMASPYPMGDFHLLFFASFLAHSELGQKQKSAITTAMSASPPIATTLRTSREVRLVSISEVTSQFWSRPRHQPRTSRTKVV